MSTRLTRILALLLVLYPLAVYIGLARFGVAPVAWLLCALALLRLAISRHQRGLWPLACLPLLMGVASAYSHDPLWLRYLPVLMNVATLLLFSYSLWRPPTVIERLARLHEPDLPPQGVLWTRRVTQVWCGFFIVNGSIAFYTVQHASLAQWTLYNGLIAYLLMALLLAGEYLLRLRMRKE